MKRFIFVLLLTWPLFGTGQTITIVDTLITKSIHQDVVAINVSMSFPLSEEKRLCIHKIHKHIVTDPLVTDELERGENTQDVGLIFVLEDNSGHIIHMPTYPGYPGFLPILSQPTLIPEDDGKDCYERRVFVDEQNMATYSKLISCDSLVYYDDSQLVISHPDTTLTLYAILQAEKLEQGRYKIYLYYSFKEVKELSSVSKSNQITSFYGVIVSNKVDLIVEDYPCKWWKKWRRKAK